ncbi:ras GTPase-activating protein-binding protein 2-like isoform X2 [Littorina saxatilis]|uniref:Ras GTPase-activating protein-binding protein 2 n=1 Tax=Littorina saxatilis TaxID=31220 RepID=A0AAN9BUP8_9CAEN
MVMANPPAGELDAESAQHVGREFVRQYYTLMHEAPYHLHRFYSQNSSFVHGGVEKPGEEQPPVVGQHEIHKKIISLGYRDCHAKIRQVDSQPTVGNAVVVQVTGELSNDGKPMRRFMQTFVLAPQSAKQYYVHNDVFRYQDEVFVDEEEDADAEETEGFSEVVENGSPSESPQQPQEPLYFEQPAQPMSNGSVHDEEEEVATVEKSKAPEEAELEAEIDSLDIEESQPTFDKAEPTPVVEPPAEPEPEPQPAPKPCSWAALVRAPNSASASQSTPTFGTVGKPSRPVEPKTETGPAPSNSATVSPGGTQPQPQRAPRPPRERFERDRSNMSRGEEGDVDSLSGRRPAGGGVGNKYPDNQQLFVGNLPHNISERELKVFFEHWGKVVELRINTKASGGKLPNFGFVVFDSPEPVQDILKQKPIKFNGEHRLNVEEKKPRGSEGRPSGRGAPRGGGPGGSRGGYSGGRGGGGIKTGGGFGRPNDGERRGMGVGGGAPRGGGGGMSGPPRR